MVWALQVVPSVFLFHRSCDLYRYTIYVWFAFLISDSSGDWCSSVSSLVGYPHYKILAVFGWRMIVRLSFCWCFYIVALYYVFCFVVLVPSNFIFICVFFFCFWFFWTHVCVWPPVILCIVLICIKDPFSSLQIGCIAYELKVGPSSTFIQPIHNP